MQIKIYNQHEVCLNSLCCRKARQCQFTFGSQCARHCRFRFYSQFARHCRFTFGSQCARHGQFSFGSYCVKYGSVLAATVILYIFFSFSDSQSKSASNISLPSLSRRYFILPKTLIGKWQIINICSLFSSV